MAWDGIKPDRADAANPVGFACRWSANDSKRRTDGPLDPSNGYPPMSEDEKGLSLWGGVDLDLTVRALKQKRCAVCGEPATAATRRLDQQERYFVCEQHRTAVQCGQCGARNVALGG